MRRPCALLFPVLALGLVAGAASARADGYVPFYGYADYYGGPAIYYSHDTDVQQTTRPEDGSLGFGVRTYSAGGPFWAYKPVRPASLSPARRHHRKVLRRKG